MCYKLQILRCFYWCLYLWAQFHHLIDLTCTGGIVVPRLLDFLYFQRWRFKITIYKFVLKVVLVIELANQLVVRAVFIFLGSPLLIPCGSALSVRFSTSCISEVLFTSGGRYPALLCQYWHYTATFCERQFIHKKI